MARLTWLDEGTHKYKLGVDMTTLYPRDVAKKTWATGVAWNGVTTVTESPSGGDENKYYANNELYLSMRGLEELGFSIEAYYSPEEFDECDGQASPAPGLKITQQTRKPFCFAYRKKIGNDTEGIDYDYEIHILYNATCSPTEESAETINESPEPGTMSWECSALPVPVPGYKPTARIKLIASETPEAALKKIEDALFGGEGSEPHVLMPAEIIQILNENASA